MPGADIQLSVATRLSSHIVTPDADAIKKLWMEITRIVPEIAQISERFKVHR